MPDAQFLTSALLYALHPPTEAVVITTRQVDGIAMASQKLSREDYGDDTIYHQLETYDWEKDKEFQGGLSAILGPNPSPNQIQDLTIRAQCFYFSRKRAIQIDYNSYKTYLINKYPQIYQSNPDNGATSTSHAFDRPVKDMTPVDRHPSSSSTQSSPANMAVETNTSHPEAPFVSPSEVSLPPRSAADQPEHKENQPTSIPSLNPTAPDAAPYPQTFADIVAMITSGEEIPGIRDIPDVVYPISMAAKPTAPRRRKPWEKDIPDDVILNGMKEGTFGDQRDKHIVQELPEEDMPHNGPSVAV
ncbi:hypothetical protein GLAREA_05568 [Glarea lozoyensis ATCC 20868]|uniref:Uncharacterized protein n=1 Tax=Glarea lozoyensis (strain ATCC 20868 / MF5171) TaxID=1116229 RepID=S3DEQ6_GLAL2|nr:uncharacterized protein GLAREA_05568 [Glarea lozoyensis ATCC 20868]EPE36230.1 hypothetical protein GLAREA_05568 [Glarea lozoyensis ATCC 20868]